MIQIVSIARDGTETPHWQVTHLDVARRLAAGVAARLPKGEVVKIRRVCEVVVRYTQIEEIEIDPDQ